VSTRVSGINQSLSSTTTVLPLNNTDFSSPSPFIPVRLQNDSSTGDPIHRSLSNGLFISNSELSISKLQNLTFSNSPCTARSIASSSDASFIHNSVCTQISNMEADCQDVKGYHLRMRLLLIKCNNYLLLCRLKYLLKRISFRRRFSRMIQK